MLVTIVTCCELLSLLLIHALDYGTHTCGGYPGSIDNLELDVKVYTNTVSVYIIFE